MVRAPIPYPCGSGRFLDALDTGLLIALALVIITFVATIIGAVGYGLWAHWPQLMETLRSW